MYNTDFAYLYAKKKEQSFAKKARFQIKYFSRLYKNNTTRVERFLVRLDLLCMFALIQYVLITTL